MSSNQMPESTGSPFRGMDIVLLTLLFAFVLAVVGVTGFFRLSPETGILRESALGSVKGTYHRTFVGHVGFFTTGLLRTGSRFFKLPPEAQACLASVRGAEVGVYKLQGAAGWVDTGTILARADKEMSARRWDRVVGVSHENEVVAVYMPRRGLSPNRMKCCVLVLHGEDLIVAGASGNLEPLLELAQQHVDLATVDQHFAIR